MSHAAEGLLQAYMDGEVTGEAAAELDAHLATCAECEAELQRMRAGSALLSAALAPFERPVTSEAVGQAYWNVRAAARRPRFIGTGALAKAAAVLLLATGGVMAVIPGSPLRRLAEGVTDSGEPAAAPEKAPAAPAPVAVEEAELPGVTLVPSEGHVLLRVWSIAPNATIRVNFVDGVRVSVQAAGDAEEVRFRSGTGRIEVMNLGSAHVAIQIPRSLPFASLEVEGRQWLFKDGDQLRLNGPVAEQATDMVVFRARR